MIIDEDVGFALMEVCNLRVLLFCFKLYTLFKEDVTVPNTFFKTCAKAKEKPGSCIKSNVGLSLLPETKKIFWQIATEFPLSKFYSEVFGQCETNNCVR